jgi:hypothetical protein
VKPLRGTQLSLTVSVPTYELENPPRKGDRLTTSAGIATVTHIDQAGKEAVIWADYGSGISQPHVSEGIMAVSPPKQTKIPRSRRHTPKGKASGWIEERVGNKKREKPSVSHYYRWENAEGKHSRYIPAGKLDEVRSLVEKRGAIAQILHVLEGNIPIT